MEAVTQHPAVTTFGWLVKPEHLRVTAAGDLSIDGRIVLTCEGIEPVARLAALEELGREIVKLAIMARWELVNEDAAS